MSKINKLGKSSFVIAILSFLLVAVLAFGGTYAYFSASAENAIKGTTKTGHLNISLAEGQETITINDQTVVPNQVFMKDQQIAADIDSNIAYYTRVTISTKVTLSDGKVLGDTENPTTLQHVKNEEQEVICGEVEELDKLLIISLTGITPEGQGAVAEEWLNSGSDHVYYKKAPTKADDAEDPTTEKFLVTAQLADWVGAEGCKFFMDADIEISITVEVIQADYIGNSDPETGVGVAFETIDDATEAWGIALSKKYAAQNNG